MLDLIHKIGFTKYMNKKAAATVPLTQKPRLFSTTKPGLKPISSTTIKGKTDSVANISKTTTLKPSSFINKSTV